MMGRTMDFDTLIRDSIGFWRIWTYTAGRRILQRLPATERELGKQVKPGPLKVWLDAAQALGLVVRKRGVVAEAPGVRRLLADRTHPDYLGGHLLYGAIRSLDYDGLEGYLRTGRTLHHLRRPRRNLAVQEATEWDHVMFLRKLPENVFRRLRRGCDVLELGCGTGQWLRRMRAEFRKSRFRGCDPDPEAARQAKAEVGWAERFGDSASADMVYLGEVLHLTDRQRALANCARVLRPGGWLIVLEGFMPERVSRKPLEAMLFAMQLDQAFQGVRFMRRSELCLPSEFGPVKFVTLGGCVAIAVASKKVTRVPRVRKVAKGK